MAIPMYPVKSSQLSYIGFDDDNNKLYVTFPNGTTYAYDNVPYTTYKELKNSESVGSYFTKNIKNKYKYRKI